MTMETLYLLVLLVSMLLLIATLVVIFWVKRQMGEVFSTELRVLQQAVQDQINRVEPSLRQEFSQSRQEIMSWLRDERKELNGIVQDLRSSMQDQLLKFQSSVNDIATGNRTEVTTLRQELTERVNQLTGDLNQKIQDLIRGLNEDMRNLERHLQQESQQNQKGVNEALERFRETLFTQVERLREVVDERIKDLSNEVSSGMSKISETNQNEIEKIRNLVSERLENALQQSLETSLKHLVESMMQVSEGIGAIREVVGEVADLKRVLTNVKHRGVLGEVQLEGLLENTLPGLYQKQFKIGEGTVDFAVQVPVMKENSDKKIWLPIDAKFSTESLQALQEAYQSGDNKKIEEAIKKFRNDIRNRAKEVQKYIAPPDTTEYAIMFLPAESLYGEVVRDQPLFEDLYRQHKVLVTGPSTLIAVLNTLAMGFRTMAIEQRAHQVVQVLSAIQKEFEKFAKTLRQAQARIRQADEEIEKLVGARARRIQNKLNQINLPALSSEEASQILDLPPPPEQSNEK